MTPAQFADSLGIGRAIVSHIQNGRNKPSLDVITKILNKMPHIASDWLLTGKGEMYKGQPNREGKSEVSGFPTDLFSQSSTIPIHENKTKTAENSINNFNSLVPEYEKEVNNRTTSDIEQNIVNERVIYKEQPQKSIKQIIIYYSDNTFETFLSQ